MDAKQFTERVEAVLKRRLKGHTFQIKRDNLPTSVEFLVTSDDFESQSRAQRIRFMAAIVEEAFGVPLTFGPMGLALTPKEFKDRPWESNSDDVDDWGGDVSDADVPAAMPVEHD